MYMEPRVPLDPSSDVLLHHKGRTITRDLKQTLQSLLKLLILEKYYISIGRNHSTRKLTWITSVLSTDKQESQMDEQILYAKTTSQIANTFQGIQIQQTMLLMLGKLWNR